MKHTKAKRYLEYYKGKPGADILRHEARYLRRHLGSCRRILDIGCGPGIFERELKDLDITGVDPDPGMLELAGETAPGARFIKGKAESLPFADRTFDGAFFVTSLEFVKDQKKAMGEAARVLTKGGRIVYLILNPESDYFKEKIRGNGYIAKGTAHIELGAIENRLSQRFEVKGEYILGIDGKRVFPSKDPDQAAIYAIVGKKKE